MNLYWLLLYLIDVFIVVVGRRNNETLEICLALIIIIILLDHNLPHTEFNSAYFEDFSTADLKLVFSRRHVVPDDHPKLFVIILF